MSKVPPRLDMLAYAKRLIPMQFRNRTNWTKLLIVITKPFQEIEDAFQDLLTLRYLSSAQGAQLDILGELVGLKRKGFDDASYLIRLRAQVLLLRSSGTQPQILRILRAVISSPTYRYAPYYPASFVIEALGPVTAAEATELGALVKAAKAAGVQGDLNYSLRARSATFGFASGATPETNPSRGFSNLTRTTGGKMAGVA